MPFSDLVCLRMCSKDGLPRKALAKLDEFQFLHLSILREYIDLVSP